jgi:hypothetical protein
MAESYKGQNIVHLLGEQIGDFWIEVVVVVPGFADQQLGFMGKAPTRQAALAEAQRLARNAIDERAPRA